MEAYAKRMTGFPLSVLFAIISTTALFVTLPLLTQLQRLPGTQPVIEPIFIDTRRPAPPPSETRDELREQTPPENRTIEKVDPPRRLQPKIDMVRGAGITGGDAGIDIGMPEFRTDTLPVSGPTYTPSEVDHAPRVLRSFPPNYPYLAKRDNIEGWVVLRFVVDTEGAATKAVVTAAEPEGIFEEAALKAVARYKFKPALKKGEAVNCIVTQRVQFSLD
jgi:protein TonB